MQEIFAGILQERATEISYRNVGKLVCKAYNKNLIKYLLKLLVIRSVIKKCIKDIILKLFCIILIAY